MKACAIITQHIIALFIKQKRDYQIVEFLQYQQLSQNAAQLTEGGKFDQAEAIYRQLLESDISDRDKSIICYNLTILSEKAGRKYDILKWYDEGIRFEERHCQYFVTEKKAIYLANIGETRDSLSVLKQLYQQPYLTEGDKSRIQQNIDILSKC